MSMITILVVDLVLQYGMWMMEWGCIQFIEFLIFLLRPINL